MPFDLELDEYYEETEMKNSPKRFLVTGGAGFVGTNLVNRLVNGGHEVIIFDNLSTGNKSNINHYFKYI